MKYNIIILLFVFFLAGCQIKQDSFNSNYPLIFSNMKIRSQQFNENGQIPQKYTCDGDDINPPLEISDIPADTKSLALIVDDPNAPSGDFVHWIVWNIPSETTKILENSIPKGSMEGRTDFGKNEWGGPCPPSGVHHYHFKVYALNTMLQFEVPPTKKDLIKAMNGHILDQAELVGIYSRKNK